MSKHQCAAEKIAACGGTVTTDERVAVAEACGMRNHGNSLFATEHPLMVSNGDGTESLIRWTSRARGRGRSRLIGAGITAAALLAMELRQR